MEQSTEDWEHIGIVDCNPPKKKWWIAESKMLGCLLLGALLAMSILYSTGAFAGTVTQLSPTDGETYSVYVYADDNGDTVSVSFDDPGVLSFEIYNKNTPIDAEKLSVYTMTAVHGKMKVVDTWRNEP